MYKQLTLCLMQAVIVAQEQNSGYQAPIAAIPAVRTLVAASKENHPAIKAAQARAQAQREQIGPLGALPDPEASFAVQRGPEKNVIIKGDSTNLHGALPGMTEYSMSWGQSIPWPGKLAAREDVARQDVARSEVGIHETILALEANILASSLELLVIQARRELVTSQLGYWEATEAIIKARLDQGGSSTSDAIQAMQEQARLRLRLLELDAQAQDKKDILNQLTVRDMTSPIELEVCILDMELPAPKEEVELLNDLKSRNPEWLVALVDIQGAEASLHSARMDRLPDLRGGVGISKAGTMPPLWRAEVGVTLPIWSGRKQNRVIAKAQAERLSAEAMKANLSLALDMKSRERARSWKLADETIRLYENEIIPQNEAALEILKARFEHGATSFASIVEALNALLKDRELRLDAVAQVHRLMIQQHGAIL